MTNKLYRRGAAFEYRTKKFLESKGWHVIRSAGSHGLADLIAIQPYVAAMHFSSGLFDKYGVPGVIQKTVPRVLFVQCKYKMPEKREALERMEAKKQKPLIDLATRLGCEAVWATNTPGSTIPNLQWLCPIP